MTYLKLFTNASEYVADAKGYVKPDRTENDCNITFPAVNGNWGTIITAVGFEIGYIGCCYVEPDSHDDWRALNE